MLIVGANAWMPWQKASVFKPFLSKMAPIRASTTYVDPTPEFSSKVETPIVTADDLACEPDQKVVDNPLQLNKILKAMPAEVFEKSLPKSLFYMFFDYAMWGAATLAMATLVKSAAWTTLPFIAKAAATFTFWNVAGFFMWCIFVVGHDCGHTNFSNFKLLNDIIGHITHGSIMVPYFPWQLSHRRHHMYHNHVDKDYSWIWYTPEKMAKPEEFAARAMHDVPISLTLFPFFGWQLYLLGVKDGSHFVPIGGKLWSEGPKVEKVKALFSAAVVGAFGAAIYALSGFNLKTMAFFYIAPHTVFSWWLICVTYLQHHGPQTLAYDNSNWSYVKAAFETVDRTFGKGIDALHHHISDGHVIHHLFFTKIPHYNLPKATAALKTYLNNNGLGHMYRHEDTPDFAFRLHKYMYESGFKATPAPIADVCELQFARKEEDVKTIMNVADYKV